MMLVLAGDFYERSRNRICCFLEKVVPKILDELCSGEMSPTQHLDAQQALVKQLAEILEFVLKFDELKMKTPAIQNDLSYYRRSIMRSKMANNEMKNDGEEMISYDVANRMSLFYAHATPMLKVFFCVQHYNRRFLFRIFRESSSLILRTELT